MSRQHGRTPRHCWAIPPNRCSASTGGGGHWDSGRHFLEVFSSDCLASEVPSGLPSHQILQQEARSSSCFSNARSSVPEASTSSSPHLDVNMTCQGHQPLSWLSYHSALHHIHIHHCSTLSQLPGEMPQEAWWTRWIWGPGMKRTRGCERFLAFMVVAAMSVVQRLWRFLIQPGCKLGLGKQNILCGKGQSLSQTVGEQSATRN